MIVMIRALNRALAMGTNGPLKRPRMTIYQLRRTITRSRDITLVDENSVAISLTRMYSVRDRALPARDQLQQIREATSQGGDLW